MFPKPKLCPPHLVMLLLLLQAKAKFILALTQTHTQSYAAQRNVPFSGLMISFPFDISLSLHSLLSFRDLPVITLYRRKQGAGLVPDRLGRLWFTGTRNFCDLCSPLWLLLQQIRLALHSTFKRSTSVSDLTQEPWHS